MTTPLNHATTLRELRALVSTYLEGSDAERAADLFDALEPATPLQEQEARERAMFGCTKAEIDEVLSRMEPRDIAMYAMETLSNAQSLIHRDRDDDEPFAWAVRRADANTIRQLMNIAKYAIDKAVPR